jgi:hypothetical protein
VDVQITCPCPGSPHAQDTVTLRDRLTFVGGVAVQERIRESLQDRPNEADAIGVLSEGYIRHGIVTWTLVGENGKPLPVTGATIGAVFLDSFNQDTMVIAEAADALYAGQVIAPLLPGASSSSPDSPTSESTSPTSTRSRRPKPKRSRRSSISTTPTVDTATTTGPLNGVSSFSPSSVSASG